MADHGLAPALQLLDPPGPLPPTLVTGINAVDPCNLPFASCTELVRFEPFLVDQAEYVAGMVTLGLIPFLDIVVAVRDTIGAAIQGEYGWAVFEVVGGALGVFVPVAGDIPGIVKDAGKWVARTAKADEIVTWVAKGSKDSPALEEIASPVLRALKPGTYGSLSTKMSDDDILRLARSGQDLDHLASMIDDATIEIASTGGRWFDETATRGHWGREAEDFIRGGTGGTSKRLDAPVAGEKFRIVDDYVLGTDGAAVNEVKTGDGRMERRLQTQIDKDAYLLGSDTVASYRWNFFPSARSNRVGPDPELLAERQANGLKVNCGCHDRAMVIGPDSEPTQAEAENFVARWPGLLRSRLDWFRAEVAPETLDGSTASLTPLLAEVANRIGEERTVDPAPEWFDATLRNGGWSPYGAALVEGLTAYLTGIYRERLGPEIRWVLENDPRSAHHLKPVFALGGVPPAWLQVRNALGRVRHGSPPDRLRSSTETVLKTMGMSARATSQEPWVEVISAGRGEWQVSFPEDIAEQLGQAAYAELEDRLNAVKGVREAIMEDRDRAIVRTRQGVDQTALTARLEAAVASLTGST